MKNIRVFYVRYLKHHLRIIKPKYINEFVNKEKHIYKDFILEKFVNYKKVLSFVTLMRSELIIVSNLNSRFAFIYFNCFYDLNCVI